MNAALLLAYFWHDPIAYQERETFYDEFRESTKTKNIYAQLKTLLGPGNDYQKVMDMLVAQYDAKAKAGDKSDN